MVTARHPDGEREYNAVFFFQVGGADLGTIPLFVGLLIALQLAYWLSSGGLEKWREKRASRESTS